MFTNLQVVSIFDILCPSRWLFKMRSVLESLAGYSNLKLVGEENNESRIHQRLIRSIEFKAQDP